MNGADCGVFTCLFAEHLSRRARLSFSQADIPYVRKRMAYEICRNEIMMVPDTERDTITFPAVGSADTATAHDSMDEQDGGSETPEHSGEESATVTLSPDALQEMKNAAMNNQNNAAPAAPPSVSPASESLLTDNRYSEITSSVNMSEEEDIGVDTNDQDMDGVMEKIGLVVSQDDTLLLTQNKSPMKLHQSINKILESITKDEVGHGVIESDEEDENPTDEQENI